MQLSTPRRVRKLDLDDHEWNPWVKEDHGGSKFVQRTCVKQKFTAGLWGSLGWNRLGQPVGSYTTFVVISAINYTAATGAPFTEESSISPASLSHHVHSWFCMTDIVCWKKRSKWWSLQTTNYSWYIYCFLEHFFTVHAGNNLWFSVLRSINCEGFYCDNNGI